MTTRTYIEERQQRGRLGHTIAEITKTRGGQPTRQISVWLPEGTSGETRMDIIQGLRRAYEAGREDRSADLPCMVTGGQETTAERVLDELLAVIYRDEDGDGKRKLMLNVIRRATSARAIDSLLFRLGCLQEAIKRSQADGGWAPLKSEFLLVLAEARKLAGGPDRPGDRGASGA